MRAPDSGFHILDVSAGKTLYVLPPPPGDRDEVRALSWSPDGSRIAVETKRRARRTIFVYSAAVVRASTIDQLLSVAYNQLRKDFQFTRDECKKYFATDNCPPVP